MPNEEYIFTVDSAAGGLYIRDARTLNNLAILLNGQGKPFKVTTKFGENLFVLDSTTRSLIIVDWKKKEIKRKIQLDKTPLSITLSNDEKKAYITFQGTYSNDGIAVIDLIQYRIVNHIITNNCPAGIFISPNGRYLYATSQCSLEKSFLSIVDLKTEKVFKSVSNVGYGQAGGITPDGKRICVSHKDSGVNQVKIIDATSFKVLKSLQINSNSFAFSLDGKYIFALAESEITIIRTLDNEIINKLPFATAPRGFVVTEDESAFVWLPEERRIFAFDIKQQLANTAAIDPELQLKKFKEELKGSSEVNELSKVKEIFDKVNYEYYTAVNSLTKELGNTYSNYQSGMNYNYKEMTYQNNYGIISIYDPNKKIVPTYILKLSRNDLILSLKETDKKEEVFKSSVNDTDWKELNKFIRNYFLIRIDQLK